MSRREERTSFHAGLWIWIRLVPDPLSGRCPFRVRPQGFSLIELLVVISIVGVLTAVLLPTLQRVRNQARAVVCQANLREWGTLYATALAENNGQWPVPPDWSSRSDEDWFGTWGWGPWGWWWGGQFRNADQYERIKGIMSCPMAARPANSTIEGSPVGGTFLSWGWGGSEYPPVPWGRHGSYGVNPWSHPYWYWHPSDEIEYWKFAYDRDAAQIPMYFDSAWAWTCTYSWDTPPSRDAVPTAESSTNCSCINRHNGYVNGLFLDWSVRKIGLKELWTLRWHPRYNTVGPWTQAGGVESEDWPAWMRAFKDY
ncbi:MAG: type II secretion system protein [Solirubrobacterales bacterium]